MRPAPTSSLTTETSDIEYLVSRRGTPVTVYAHGLLGSIAQTRPFASGVPGTAAFLHLRGHGRTRALAGRWDYPALAGELRAVADRVRATRAVGVSLGAGAIMRLLAADPSRFDRVVLVLPTAIDGARGGAAPAGWDTLADRVDAADVVGVARALLAAQPRPVGELAAARQYYTEIAAEVVGSAATATALRTLPRAAPVDERDDLRRVEAPVLVVCQPDDPLHPVGIGADLATAFPAGRLHVLGSPGALWLARDELRSVLTDFLAAP